MGCGPLGEQGSEVCEGSPERTKKGFVKEMSFASIPVCPRRRCSSRIGYNNPCCCTGCRLVKGSCSSLSVRLQVSSSTCTIVPHSNGLSVVLTSDITRCQLWSAARLTLTFISTHLNLWTWSTVLRRVWPQVVEHPTDFTEIVVTLCWPVSQTTRDISIQPRLHMSAVVIRLCY